MKTGRAELASIRAVAKRSPNQPGTSLSTFTPSEEIAYELDESSCAAVVK